MLCSLLKQAHGRFEREGGRAERGASRERREREREREREKREVASREREREQAERTIRDERDVSSVEYKEMEKICKLGNKTYTKP